MKYRVALFVTTFDWFIAIRATRDGKGRWMNKTVGLSLALVLGMCGAVVVAPSAGWAADNDPWQLVLKRDFGTCEDAMKAIREQVEPATADQKPALEGKCVAILESSEATMPAKDFACRMLRYVGSAKCIPAVAKLLTDEKLSHIARWVLQGVADPAAEKALLDAMGKTSGNLRLGIIETLGERHGATALAALARLLGDNDVATVEGALKAIGKIGGPQAADVVEKAKVAPAAKAMWCDAMLACAGSLATAGQKDRAEKMLQAIFDGDNPSIARVAAMSSLIAARKLDAMPLIMTALKAGDRKLAQAAAASLIQMPGKDVTLALAKQMPDLPPAGKVVVLNVLGARGDKAVSQAVNKMAADSDPAVRLAAIGALATVGDASSVEVLAGRLSQPDEAGAATDALGAIEADGAVAAMLKLAESGPTDVRKVMFDVLAKRKAAEAVPLAYKAVGDPDAGVRVIAVRMIGTLGGADDVPKLADMLRACKDDGLRGEIARALSDTASRTKQVEPVLAALAKADDATKPLLLEVLGVLQGDKALEAVRAALGSSNVEVKRSAVRAISGWRDMAPMAELLKLAKEDSDEANKILALRGYISMIPKISSEADRFTACKTAMDLASRPDEKRLVLSPLGSVRTVEALELAEKYLDDPALKNEAMAACGSIAVEIAGKNPDKAVAVLERFIASSKDRRMVDRARKALENIKANEAKSKKSDSKKSKSN
jgi:HEAT repeat protein